MDRRRRRGFGLLSADFFRRRARNRYNIRMRRRNATDGRKPRFEKEAHQDECPGSYCHDYIVGVSNNFACSMQTSSTRMFIFEPTPPVEPDLTIVDVDLQKVSNTKEHHTSEYDVTDDDLIVRRGHPFDITIELNREYDKDKDELKLVFSGGTGAKVSRGTLVPLVLSRTDKEKEWGAWTVKKEGKMLTVRVNTPPDCYVGKWMFSIETIQKSDTDKIIFEFENEQHIYILFNPWCKDDQVYLPDASLLEEYVLNEAGKIYTGSMDDIRARRWVFGQFEEKVLECAMYLLDEYLESWTVRGDPVKVCRRLTQIINDGVLVGNWTGDYKGGKSPLHWTGSAAILEKFFDSKNPVCFGQCWVFSGLMTTLCRTLGIPVRSVTNFASAHDCDGSITIDSHFHADGEPEESLNDDSVWNFHVWNDVWMARPDLPLGYGGWQAVDATPQELSDGQYQCGPSPLEAIRRGEVYLPFDAPFVFAEVNADRLYWSVDENGDTHPIGINANSIGKRISTKFPKGKKPQDTWEKFCYDGEREDVTNNYKYKEGSEEERAAVIKANQASSKQGLYHKKEHHDVDFELVDKDKILYGNDIEVVLKINNKSDEVRTVSGCLSTTSVYYTGVPAEKVKSFHIAKEKIQPKSKKDVKLVVTFDEYFDKLVDQCHMMMSCMCKVAETRQTYVDKDAFVLNKPELTIKAPAKGRVGKEIKIEVSFANPLKCDLTGCKLTVEGPGLQKPTDIGQSIVSSKQTFMTTIAIVPKKIGLKTLVVAFNSKQIEVVEGNCEITIE